MAASGTDETRDDRVIPKGTIIYTLSFDPNRTRSADMFYAVYRRADLDQYLTMHNGSLLHSLFDDPNKGLSAETGLKYEIINLTNRDLHMAGERSATRVFADLFDSDVDFREFVVDPARMQAHFRRTKYLYKGYLDARAALARLRRSRSGAKERDLALAYRMFNHVIPSDGGGSQDKARDIERQRGRFFAALRREGFGATLDTNDVLYGGFRSNSAIIVFDTEGVDPLEVRETSDDTKRLSTLVATAARHLGLNK